MQTLRVLQYKGHHWLQYYYVVLKDKKVYYWIGPVPSDEKTEEAVAGRYGKIKIEERSALAGHNIETVEVARYDDVVFIRPPGVKEFTAKLVKPTKKKTKKRRKK